MVNFKIEKVSKRVTRIYGICTELMYLVEGDEKAVLLDTGSGFGSLRKLVEGLTDKEIIALLTHGHTDHAMGAGEFETVYMSKKDSCIYEAHGDEAFRWDGIEMSEEFQTITKDDYISTTPLDNILNLSGGDSFDIGGCTIDIFDCPGHTNGSVVMLLREERMLLLGDACNSFTFLFEDYSTTIKEYEASLRRLKVEVEGTYDVVLASHGDGKLPLSIIDEVIQVCEDIRRGNVDNIPFDFRGHSGLIAKKVMNLTGVREDGKIGNIVYNKEKIM